MATGTQILFVPPSFELAEQLYYPDQIIRGGLRAPHAQQTKPAAKVAAKGTAYLQ